MISGGSGYSTGFYPLISGGGILKHAPNKTNAVKLIEFLLTKEAQEHIVNNTFEYPMIDGVKPHDLVVQMNGSISAEHGIGSYKREELAYYASPTKLSLIKTIKQAIDPKNIMNPGKMLDLAK